MRVLILHDAVPAEARPDERDNLIQAEEVATALRELGHEPRMLAFTSDLKAVAGRVRALRPDVVFNLVESVEGGGRLIHVAQGLLETLGIPFTGCGSHAMFLTSNKLAAKRFLTLAGVATPNWATATATSPKVEIAADRFIIKSVWEDASLGLDDDAIYHPHDAADLRREIRCRIPRLSGEAFAEVYIEGREFNLSLLERPDAVTVLPPAEIEFRDYPPGQPHIVGYRAKWQEDSHEYHNTIHQFDFPAVDQSLLAAMSGVARKCWALFELGGYARVDFRVDEAGCPWVLEINANPCLSSDAGFVAAAAHAGTSFAEVIAEILAAALRRGGHACL